MKAKTDWCCVVSCDTLVVNIILHDMTNGGMSPGKTSQGMPYSTQATICIAKIPRHDMSGTISLPEGQKLGQNLQSTTFDCRSAFTLSGTECSV